jgi:uncharacterized membrane protein
MMGLTTLGVFHTAIALVALVCGLWALARDKEISPHNRLGQAYLVTTLVAAVTALGIFRHGGFGPPHALAILTLFALAVGTVAAKTKAFGRASRYVQVFSYSSTLLFHLIPGFAESLTRLPPGAPVLASQEAPMLQVIFAALLVIFLIGVALQFRAIHAAPPLVEVDDEAEVPS